MPDEKTRLERWLTSPNALLTFISSLVTLIVLIHFTWPEEKRKAEEAEKARTFGACALKPQTPANIKRLSEYIADGEKYKDSQSFKIAAQQFQKVITADSNYPGAHEDLGVVQLAQGDLEGARSSIEAEITLLDCLRSVPPEHLHHFAYWFGKNAGQDGSAPDYVERLNAAEDTAHYNLACVFARQGEQVVAINELKKAAQHHSIKRENVLTDSDLTPLRHQAGFASALALF